MRETETSMIARIKSKVKWEEWKEQVNSQIASGLRVKEWCRQNNVNAKTYYYHLRRVREKLCDEQEHSVVPINVPELKVSRKIHIEKNGLSITLPSDISCKTLIALVPELC